MKLIPGTQISVVEQCSAHDGTWAMKDDYFELSMKWGKKCFSGMMGANPQTPVTDCPLAALQIEQATGLKPIHPVQVLQKAYHGKDQT
jgi:Fe-S oxidoreductase